MSSSPSHYRVFFKVTAIVGISVILSRILGLFREQYSLYLFGVGWELDAYVSAYKIPTVLRNLLGEGAFSVVFISIFSVLWPKNRRAGQRFFNQVITYLFLFSLILAIICFILTPYYMSVIHRSVENFPLTVHLSRIMIFFINFISLSGILMGVLNSQGKYLIPAVAPAIANVVNILIIVLGHKALGIDVLAVGYLCSAIVLFAIQVPFVWKIGVYFNLDFSFSPRLRFFLRAFLPVAFGMAFFQINQLLTNRFSSEIEGGNTIVDRAFLIIQMAIAVLSAGISTALLPIISREQNLHLKHQIYRQSMKTTFLIVFPVVILFFAFGHQISSFIYLDLIVLIVGDLGKIHPESIQKIGEIIVLFAPGILVYSLLTMTTRAFQGMRMYAYPLLGSMLSTVLNIFIMWYFFPRYGLNVLPISLVLSSCVNFLLLMIFLRKGVVQQVEKVKSQNAFLLQNLVAGGIMYFCSIKTYSVLDMYFSNLYNLPITFMIGMGTYFCVLYLLREDLTRAIYRNLFSKK